MARYGRPTYINVESYGRTRTDRLRIEVYENDDSTGNYGSTDITPESAMTLAVELHRLATTAFRQRREQEERERLRAEQDAQRSLQITNAQINSTRTRGSSDAYWQSVLSDEDYRRIFSVTNS